MSAGLKMYLNETFTTLRLDEMSTWMKVRTLKAPTDWRLGLYPSKALKNMCSKSCLVPSNKQPLDVAKLVEARWPGLRTENCNKGLRVLWKKLRFSLFWRLCQYVFQWGWGQGIQILNSFCLVSARFCLFLVRRVKDDDIWYFSVLWNDVRSKGQDSTFSRKFGFSFLGLFNKWTWAKVG